jgi:hypothetical protein
LTFLDFVMISCDYCGEGDEIDFRMINADEGLTLENLKCICETCKRLVGRLSSKDFIDHCEKVVIYPDC